MFVATMVLVLGMAVGWGAVGYVVANITIERTLLVGEGYWTGNVVLGLEPVTIRSLQRDGIVLVRTPDGGTATIRYLCETPRSQVGE